MRWYDKMGCCILSVTALISDLIRLIGQYVVPLEHQWTSIPNDFRHHKSNLKFCQFCDGGQTSMTFPSCGCFATRKQHTCSIYTMSESCSTRFRIHIKAVRFWVGIIWTSNPSLNAIFPPITWNNPRTHDFPDTTLRIRDQGLGGFLLTTIGRILLMSPGPYFRVYNRPMKNYKEFDETIFNSDERSCSIEISIANNIFRLNAVYYIGTRRLTIEPFECQMIVTENIRPFIQMTDLPSDGTGEEIFDPKKMTARIETLLDDD